MPNSAVIRSVAHYVPDRVVTNDDLSKLMDTSDEWITERSGIKERRFAEEGTPTSELGAKAADAALRQAGIDKSQVDYLLASTLSPDLYFPGIGTILQQKLGLGEIPALDLRVQCSGLVYGLSVADALIRSGQAKCVLLVCAEVQSPVLDMSDKGRDMAVLFGDGAGALVIQAVECAELPSVQNSAQGVIDSLLGSDGSGAEILCMKRPGTSTPGFILEEDFAADKFHPQMDGRQVFKNAVHRLCEATETILTRNQVPPTELSLIVPHQANIRINEAIREKLALPPESFFNNIERYGNTTSATIPICLSEAEAAGQLSRGDLVLTLAFGAGFTWGANLIRW